MDSSIPYNDDEMIESQLSNTQALEAAYRETLRNADLIIKDEGARRLRLRILMLENENDDLHEQLALGDDRIDILEQECSQLREELAHAQEEVSRQETELRTQSRELSNVKAELTSMNGITTDSTRLLTEKLSLSRELATLKPELEHLRSQALYQQTVLAEKLSLQRQVATLEVELETEQRAAKRAAEKSIHNEKEADLQGQVEKLEKELAREKRERAKSRQDAEADLQSQIETLQSELTREKRERSKARKDAEAQLQGQLEGLQRDLARERKEREKIQREAAKELKASESQQTILESKMDQLKTKLASTKDQLKECQAELIQARSMVAKASAPAMKRDMPATNPLKRNAQQMSNDGTIGTPDGVAIRGKRPGGKRSKIDQTVLGEKSMFSITPYLNRTTNIAPDTPVNEDSDDPTSPNSEPSPKTHEATTSEAREASPSALVPVTAKPKGRSKKTKNVSTTANNVLGDAKTSKVNNKPAPKRMTEPSKLERVVEEEADENKLPEGASEGARLETTKEAANPSKVVATKLQRKDAEPEEPEPKKKKRKLLGTGKTLFDEDDGEAARRPAKMTLGPARLLGKGGFGAGLKIASSAGFGAFSPLKKDRRGVGASFLA